MDTVFPFLELFTLTKNTMDTAFLVFTLKYFYLLCNFFQSLFTPHVFWFSPWGANVLVKVLFDSKCLLASGAAECLSCCICTFSQKFTGLTFPGKGADHEFRIWLPRPGQHSDRLGSVAGLLTNASKNSRGSVPVLLANASIPHDSRLGVGVSATAIG